MINYPTYTANGIMCTTLFNPSIRHGGKVKVQSDLKPASGEWTILTLSHTLDSEVPRGNWFTRFEAINPTLAPPVTR